MEAGLQRDMEAASTVTLSGGPTGPKSRRNPENVWGLEDTLGRHTDMVLSQLGPGRGCRPEASLGLESGLG